MKLQVNLGRGRHKLGVGGIVSMGALELRAANRSERVAVELDSAGPVPTLAVEDEELSTIGLHGKTCLSELKLLRQRPQKARDMLALQQQQQQQQEHTPTADGTGEESCGRGRPRQAAPQKWPRGHARCTRRAVTASSVHKYRYLLALLVQKYKC